MPSLFHWNTTESFWLFVKNVIQINTRLGNLTEQKKDESQNGNTVPPIESTSVYTPDTTNNTTVPFTTSFATPTANEPEAALPQPDKKEVFCPYCGVKYDRSENTVCPACGKSIPE